MGVGLKILTHTAVQLPVHGWLASSWLEAWAEQAHVCLQNTAHTYLHTALTFAQEAEEMKNSHIKQPFSILGFFKTQRFIL